MDKLSDRTYAVIATGLAVLALILSVIAVTADDSGPRGIAQLSSAVDQSGGGVVDFDTVGDIDGASIDLGTGELTVTESGDWLVVAAPQVGSIEAGKAGVADFWLSLNGEDVADSNVTWASVDDGEGDVIVAQLVLSLESGDVLQVIWSTTGPHLEAITTEGEPLTPSIIFTAVLVS